MAENKQDERFEQMVDTLNDLGDGELMSLYRYANFVELN